MLGNTWLMRMSQIVGGFRYTRDTGFLTHSQRLFYEKNGYLLFPKFIPQSILDKCHKRFDDVVAGKVERGNIIVMRDVKDRKSVNKIQDINYDKVFCEYIENKNLLDVVECFTGPNIMAIHNMLIAKPPDIGYGSTKHPPHQDLYYFPLRPADNIVAAWTAMEKCDVENGCLYVAPGSHRHDKLYRHDYPPNTDPHAINKFYYGIVDLPETIDWEELEMEPGDTVFFHPLLVHGSGVNRSTRTRRAISCHYASANCHYMNEEDIKTTRVHEEIMEHVKKRYPGISLEYKDIWHLKSTLVRGIKSTL